eukprot:jgi/Psemu1/8814/gm1.8814_g
MYRGEGTAEDDADQKNLSYIQAEQGRVLHAKDGGWDFLEPKINHSSSSTEINKTQKSAPNQELEATMFLAVKGKTSTSAGDVRSLTSGSSSRRSSDGTGATRSSSGCAVHPAEEPIEEASQITRDSYSADREPYYDTDYRTVNNG